MSNYQIIGRITNADVSVNGADVYVFKTTGFEDIDGTSIAYTTIECYHTQTNTDGDYIINLTAPTTLSEYHVFAKTSSLGCKSMPYVKIAP